MSKVKSLIGQQFGKLTVIEMVEIRPKVGAIWKTQCECGEFKIVVGKYLKKGETKNCDKCSPRAKNELIGQKFDKWTVVSKAENIGRHSAWNLKCDCGTERIVNENNLLSGKTTSCGCNRFVNHEGQKYQKLTIIKKLGNEGYYECNCECGQNKITHIKSLQSGDTRACGHCERSTIPKELTGQKFGMLTVLEKVENIGGKTAWNTKCDCGNQHIVKTMLLMNGSTQSCGCQVNYNKTDHTGKRFGRLLVLEPFDVQGSNWYYLCQCDCGEETIVNGNNLISGKTRSCGCLAREITSRRMSLQIGDKNNAWKGGVTQKSDRNKKEYKQWRKSVLARDNYICKVCGAEDNLEAHHLYSFVDNPKYRFNVDFGITICLTCHDVFHACYGSGDNTPQQFEDFLKSLGI